MSQIFKTPIPINQFKVLLDNLCVKQHGCYIFNNDSYKRGIFNNSIPEFLEKCKEYYHLSKHKYLEKKMTYNGFTTIIRQICNNNNIRYTSKLKYDKSVYIIYYYIYINDDLT